MIGLLDQFFVCIFCVWLFIYLLIGIMFALGETERGNDVRQNARKLCETDCETDRGNVTEMVLDDDDDSNDAQQTAGTIRNSMHAQTKTRTRNRNYPQQSPTGSDTKQQQQIATHPNRPSDPNSSLAKNIHDETK